jgi:ribonuclease BN (tRNA processing enzyme)
MNHRLIVNGLDAAFLQEFGCDCPRCTRQERVANTSLSLVSLDDDGETVSHILFDVGMNVADSLLASPYLVGPKARLDRIILTHWHPDHVLDLNRLCESWFLTLRRRGQPKQKVPLWCRSGTGEWLQKNQSYEWGQLLEPHLSGEYEPPGVRLDPIPLGLAGVRVTPVTISHMGADIHPDNPKEPLNCCAGYVVETEATKAVLLWDIDNQNTWIEQPAPHQREAVRCLFGADHLFIDCTSWDAEVVNGKQVGHISLMTVRRYVRALLPKETLLIHLSGHTDWPGNPGFGWPDWKWEQEAKRLWAEQELPGVVRIPRMGEEFKI